MKGFIQGFISDTDNVPSGNVASAAFLPARLQGKPYICLDRIMTLLLVRIAGKAVNSTTIPAAVHGSAGGKTATYE
jgi:hypothetical protein